MASPLQIAIRTDASVTTGAGHVMRCLTLAEELRGMGAEVSFVCRGGVGNGLDIIHDRGFRTHALDDVIHWRVDAEWSAQALSGHAPVDWIVADHYGLDWRWESCMRQTARHILVIDDLADRTHDCEILLDQNFYVGAANRYAGRVPAGCRLFLGPAFALLRTEFRDAARRPRERNGRVKRLLVAFGATDPTNETRKVLTALETLASLNLEVDVVTGSANPRRGQIEARCATLPGVHCHVQTHRMAELMWAADLAIGAGGTTMWECCVMALPALTVVTASNQLKTTNDVSATGAIWYLGRAESLTTSDYVRALQMACQSSSRLQAISQHARSLMGDATAPPGQPHPLIHAMFDLQFTVETE